MIVSVRNNNKIKVMLTAEDMRSRGITFDGICQNSAEARSFFSEIIGIAAAERETDLSEGSIIIEGFPTVSGGCVIYLSKDDSSCIIAVVSDDYAVLRRLCERLDADIRSALYTDSDLWLLIVFDSSAKELAGEYCQFIEISGIEAAAIREHCRPIFEQNAVREIIQSARQLPPACPHG